MKTCSFCKGPIRLKRIDHMARHKNGCVLIRNIEVEICEPCGEVYLDAKASRQIDEALRNAGQAEQHLDVPVVLCR